MSPLWLHGEVGEHGYRSSAVGFEQCSQSGVVPAAVQSFAALRLGVSAVYFEPRRRRGDETLIERLMRWVCQRDRVETV